MEQALDSVVSLLSAVTEESTPELKTLKNFLTRSYLSQHGGEEEPTVEVLARWLFSESFDMPAEPSLSVETTEVNFVKLD